MKLCAKLFSLLIILVVCSTAPAMAIQSAVRDAGLSNQAITFGDLLKQTVVTLDTAAAITATDIVSTGTESVYFLPDDFEYPIKLRLQNHGTASITYVPYVTTVASGITLPTATAGHLLTPLGASVTNSNAYEAIFYEKPNISIGAGGSQEVVIEVWGIKGEE